MADRRRTGVWEAGVTQCHSASMKKWKCQRGTKPWQDLYAGCLTGVRTGSSRIMKGWTPLTKKTPKCNMLTPSQDSIRILLALYSQKPTNCFSSGAQLLDINGPVRPVCVAQPCVYNPDNTVNEGGRHLNTADLAWMAAALDFMLSDWSASWAFSISSLPTWWGRKKKHCMKSVWWKYKNIMQAFSGHTAIYLRWSPHFFLKRIGVEIVSWTDCETHSEWHRYVTSPTHLCNTYMSLLRRLVNLVLYMFILLYCRYNLLHRPKKQSSTLTLLIYLVYTGLREK